AKRSKPMTNFLTTLSNDFSKLLDATNFHDSVIRVGNREDIRSFEAHSIILYGRCNYFRAALSHGWVKKIDGKFHFNLVDLNITPGAFVAILNGKIFPDQHDLSLLLQLLIATDILLLNELFDFAEEQIVRSKSMWMESDFISILRVALQAPAASKLNLCCQEIIADHPYAFFESPEFLRVEESLLVHVLESEALGMEEIKIWERVIDWGIKNTPPLGRTLIPDFSEEQFESLRSTLKNVLPLVRFFSISHADWDKRVAPFRKILSCEDLSEQVHFYLGITNFPPPCVILPPHSPSFDSILINRNMAGLIATWIDKKDLLPGGDKGRKSYNGINMPYNFKLLYRYRSHGPPPNIARHDGAIVIIMKMKHTGDLIGGYNPIDFSSRQNSSGRDVEVEYSDTEDSFIFSFIRSDKGETKAPVKNNLADQGPTLSPIRATIRYYTEDGSLVPEINSPPAQSNIPARHTNSSYDNNAQYSATLSRVKKECSKFAVGFSNREIWFGQSDLHIYHRLGRRHAGTIGSDGKWYGRPKDPDRLNITMQQKTYEKLSLGKLCCERGKDIEISEMEVFRIVKKPNY
ncbi:4514_t:CDS:2, partial [Acaulospora colombiana]